MDTALLKTLKEIFEQFPNFWNGETLQRSLVIDAIQKKEADVIKALINNEKIKTIYSTDVDGILIFDFDKLISLLKYKEYWADSFTKYRNKVGLTSEGKYLDYSSDVVLDFPFKDCVLEGGMTKEDQVKDEVYYNEIIARDEIDRLFSPKVFTNTKRYTSEGIEEEVTQFNDDNLIIRGNNLIALSSILDVYKGKVKLIYIDPPYYFSKKKKEDTFLYNSNFKLSTWLTFMKNRLNLAKDLLSEDGAIFVQISDDGVAELHCLMKEIFNTDQNNFINKITVRTKSPSGFSSVNPGVFETAEYILSFAKNKSKWLYNKQYVSSDYDANYKLFIPNIDDHYEEWEIVNFHDFVAEKMNYKNAKEAIKSLGDEIFFKKVGDYAIEYEKQVFRYTEIGDKAGSFLVNLRNISKSTPNKIFKFERENFYDVYVLNGKEIAFYNKKVRFVDNVKTPVIQLSNIWTDISYEGIASEGGVQLKGGKKPEKLLRRIIEMSTNEGDLVMDFHLGSGTTTATAHKLKRKYIGIEQLKYEENDSLKRMQKVLEGDQSGISKVVNWKGGDSFVYTELMELNYAFIHKIEQAETNEDLIQLFVEMNEKAHLNYQIELERVLNKEYEIDGVDHLVSFNDLEIPEQKDLLIKLLDKNQLYVNFSEIEDKNLSISESDKAFTNSFYQGGA